MSLRDQAWGAIRPGVVCQVVSLLESRMTSRRLLMQIMPSTVVNSRTNTVLPGDSPVLSHPPPLAPPSVVPNSSALPFIHSRWSWSPSHKACSMHLQPSQNGNVSPVDPPRLPTRSKLNSKHTFCKHTVTSHSSIWNFVQKIRRLKPTVLSRELRSWTSNGDSTLRRIDLKSCANSTSTQGGSTLMKT